MSEVTTEARGVGRPLVYLKDVRKEVLQMLKNGWSVRQVAAELGISKSTVHRIGQESE